MKLLLLSLAVVTLASAQNKCGQTPVKPMEACPDGQRIVGGCEATPYSWPWQIGFYESYFGSYSLICGGSLIDNQWVMTAGHCVYGSEDKPGKFRVKAGLYDRAAQPSGEPGMVTVEVEKIYLHPKFNMQKIEWDISLLKLKTPIKYTDHIQPVCVPNTDDGIIVEPHLSVVTGWGTLHEGDYGLPKKLHQVDVPFLNQTHCDKEYGAESINDEVMFCAGRTGVDSCQGDSGGPLVKKSADGSWFEYGIVSWGRGCAEPGYAGVYSRVSAYCDFIKKTVGKEMCSKP
jgi:secreted trypsin-like serine protease